MISLIGATTQVQNVPVAVQSPVDAALLLGSGGLIILSLVLLFLYHISTRLILLDQGLLTRPFIRYKTFIAVSGAGSLLGGLGMIMYASGITFLPLWVWMGALGLSYCLFTYLVHRSVRDARQLQQQYARSRV